jgi:hypothetical protein
MDKTNPQIKSIMDERFATTLTRFPWRHWRSPRRPFRAHEDGY